MKHVARPLTTEAQSSQRIHLEIPPLCLCVSVVDVRVCGCASVERGE
jgi:hypothetical protein